MKRSPYLVPLLLVLLLSGSSQAPERPNEDSSKYYGLEYGCAGIAVVMLESGDNSSLSPAKQCLETLWDHRSQYEGRAYGAWAKTTEASIIYPGMKYGAAGILHAFVQTYLLTNESIWLDRAVEGYNSLMDQALNESTLPHWGYAYSLPNDPYAVPITDLKYGSGGVLLLNLELYEQTGNQTLLIEGERMINWLQQASELVESGGINYNVIPWYDLEDPFKPFITAYGLGLAGLAPLLYRYGEVMGSSTVKNWAYEQAKFVESLQFENGSWPYKYGGSQIFNGLDEGVAGVLKGLHEFSVLKDTPEFDTTIRKGIDYLFSVLVDNSTHFGFPVSSDNPLLYNNMAQGLTGILSVLVELDSYLTQGERELVARGIEYLLTDASFTVIHEGDEVLFLKQPWLEEKTVDFSYSEGLTGLLEFLSKLPTTYRDMVNLDLSAATSSLVKTLVIFQGEDGLWPKQRSLLPVVETSTFDLTKDSSQSASSEVPLYLTPLPVVLGAMRRRRSL